MINANEFKEKINSDARLDFDCHKCFKKMGGIFLSRMIVCPNCGNKRCPKASDHELNCSGSSDAGQSGSVYA